MTVLLFFIFGLIVGSFLNAVIFRLHANESFLSGRSKCMHCGHKLAAPDLIPLLSFLLLKGRCRYCQARISWQYPAVEFITGLSFGLIAMQFPQSSLMLISELLFASVLIVIGVYDLKHFLILDKVVFPFLIVVFVLNLAVDFSSSCLLFSLQCRTSGGLLAAALASGFFFLQYMLSKGRWIGFGDVKFGLLLGLIAGWPQILTVLFFAYIFGAVAGLILIAAGKKTLSSKLPLGTFLAFSGIFSMVVGQNLMLWYLALIGLK